MAASYETELEQHVSLFARMGSIASVVDAAAEAIGNALQGGNKIMLCGNGGSAADAQHIAAELVVRFENERRPLPAMALTTDSSVVTASSNDYSFSEVFSRQVEAFGRPGDILLAISTSGTSKNIVAAAEAARRRGVIVVALTGETGGDLAVLAQYAVKVPSDVTSRIQEAHIFVGHFWCKSIDAKFRTPRVAVGENCPA